MGLPTGRMFLPSDIWENYKLGDDDCKTPFLAEPLANRVLKLFDVMPAHWGLCLDDAVRSMDDQVSYFEKECKRQAKEHPGYTKARIWEAASKFVANPYGLLVPPHTTGLAADIFLLI